MSVIVNGLRNRLQKEILSASSVQEIERNIEAALTQLSNQTAGDTMVGQFIDLMINDLAQSDDLDKTKIQLNNIRRARILLNEIKFYRKFEAL